MGTFRDGPVLGWFWGIWKWVDSPGKGVAEALPLSPTTERQGPDSRGSGPSTHTFHSLLSPPWCSVLPGGWGGVRGLSAGFLIRCACCLTVWGTPEPHNHLSECTEEGYPFPTTQTLLSGQEAGNGLDDPFGGHFLVPRFHRCQPWRWGQKIPEVGWGLTETHPDRGSGCVGRAGCSLKARIPMPPPGSPGAPGNPRLGCEHGAGTGREGHTSGWNPGLLLASQSEVVQKERTRGALWEPLVAPARCPGEWKLCGDFPHLKAPQRRGFLSPFPSPARCPSFNTGLIFFLLRAQRCRREQGNGPCPGGRGHPQPRVTNESTLSLLGTQIAR